MKRRFFALIFAAVICSDAFAGVEAAGAGGMPWWAWPVALFVVCLLLGVLAVPAGVGGGVLFVPIVAGFFPFHLDFVRGAGLLVALAGALSAGPQLLKTGLANLRLALAPALIASTSSIGGAMLGMAMPVATVQVALGVAILAIVGIMVGVKPQEGYDASRRPDRLASALRLYGVFHDRSTGRDIAWCARRTPLGLALFVLVGMLAGMFGLGAGWANLPTLNLVMGIPLKVSAGTSSFILTFVDSSAAWVYLNRGAILPMVAVPSVIGMMLGARLGARLLHVLPARDVRRLVLVLLLFAGGRMLTKGLGWWP